MSNTVIKVENLGKSYMVGHNNAKSESYTALRDVIARDLKNFARKTRDMFSGKAIIQGDEVEEFWALKDVSFEIKQGDRVGIIGRNGAGKSTLLKILSRITEPTSGRISIRGRVASLLEVGTGFHPELSGRENIFLNGAILGMSRKEIQRKFDEIVAFAEVERFLDTPVKRYSSGMYVRLAFAVAAHMEPEILIVDEVLAVGDAQFRKKCLGKMEDVSSEGRTILFVSHNMPAVLSLCSRAILMKNGLAIGDSTTTEIIKQYSDVTKENLGERIWSDMTTAPGTDKVRLHSVRFVSMGVVTSEIEIENELKIELEFWNLKEGAMISSSIHLLDHLGGIIFASGNSNKLNITFDEWYGLPHPRGMYKTTCVIPANFLNNGRYSINVFVITDATNLDVLEKDILTFNATESAIYRDDFLGGIAGVIRPRLAWTTQRTKTGLDNI